MRRSTWLCSNSLHILILGNANFITSDLMTSFFSSCIPNVYINLYLRIVYLPSLTSTFYLSSMLYFKSFSYHTLHPSYIPTYAIMSLLVPLSSSFLPIIFTSSSYFHLPLFLPLSLHLSLSLRIHSVHRSTSFVYCSAAKLHYCIITHSAEIQSLSL